jgi:hypothetical protein
MIEREKLKQRIASDPDLPVEAGGMSGEPLSALEWHQENRHKFLTGEQVYPYGHSKEKIEYLNEVAMLEAYHRAALTRTAAPSDRLSRCPNCSVMFPNPAQFTDKDLYDAYLLGCEDECIPEPKTKERFMEVWNGTTTRQPS